MSSEPPAYVAATDTPRRLDSARLAANAAWLAQLRWVAVAGQLITIGFVAYGLRAGPPAGPLFALAGVIALTNAVFTLWVRHRRSHPGRHLGRRVWHAVLGGLMLLDLLVLTAMLSLTGGPTNPFAVFYFVNLALCGVLLPARWAWLLNAMAVVAFVVITYRHVPLDLLRDPTRLDSFYALGGVNVVSLGAVAAFSACATVIVSFATRLTRELRRAQEAKTQADELRARSEKLEALGTLAAGAAHELATPLGTIAVAAGELQHDLDGAEGVSDDTRDDVRLIRESLARCRRILDRMATDSGLATGEALETLTAGELIDEVLEELADGARVRMAYQGAAEAELRGLPLTVPATALSQSIRAVVQNALDADAGAGAGADADADSDVALELSTVEDRLILVVTDHGPGMPVDVLARAGEPFFTTKEPGRGMGLGLFLARSVVERIGGELEIWSEAGEGTAVSITLPTAKADDARTAEGSAKGEGGRGKADRVEGASR